MTQSHLDRLTAVDASFLVQEGPTSHMHVGALLVFEDPPPSYDDLVESIRSRLHLVPRYRQKLVEAPLDSGRPLWADDPSFNLEFHIRHTALPAPGTEEQLHRLAARIHSQQLDRGKPLWETWLIEGLEPGTAGGAGGRRWALISKTHHALVDGVAGVDLATVLFDVTREGRPAEGDLEPWHPHPEPTGAELLAAGVRGGIKGGLGVATRAVKAVTDPGSSLRVARDAAEGLGEIVWAGLNPAPESPLNVEIGPHRRLEVVSHRLEDYQAIKRTLGGTVNDVVLTVVSGALGRWLRRRGVRTSGLELRALVPVSIRSEQEHGQLGNRIAAMRGPLPVFIEDPEARLAFVREAMDGLKESKQAVGAEVMASVQSLAPPTVLAQASRLNFSTRLFNLIVTNVPGPQFPLYALGRRLQALYPIAFLPKDHAMAVAIMSYDGGLNYGLLADYDALPDVGLIATEIDDALAELKAAAGGEKPAARKPAAKREGGPGSDMRAKRRSATPAASQ